MTKQQVYYRHGVAVPVGFDPSGKPLPIDPALRQEILDTARKHPKTRGVPTRTSNPFGPDGSLSVRSKITGSGWIVAKWGNVTQLIRRFTGADEGVVAIEAAIVLPVILVLMAVSFELGSMQLAKSAVVFATQQAAVVQSTGGNPQTSFAGNVARTPASSGAVTCNTTGNVATCTGTANFQNAFAGILGASPTIALAYTATVQVPQ
jgi:TadE-like protein